MVRTLPELAALRCRGPDASVGSGSRRGGEGEAAGEEPPMAPAAAWRETPGETRGNPWESRENTGETAGELLGILGVKLL